MHFYDREGKSCHEIVGANKKLRATTIRDAKKHGWFPSVTTIMDIQAKPFLAIWMQEQILQTAYEIPYNDYWIVEDWLKEIRKVTKIRTSRAAERGTEIHNKLDEYYKTGYLGNSDEEYLIPAIELIDKTWPGVKWSPEESFVNEEVGYAGRVDLHNKDGIVIDFKTKDKKELEGVQQYDDHKMQLSAYQEGLKLPVNTERYNLFISTNPETPGFCKLIKSEEHTHYINLFTSLCEVWRLKNKYDPRSI